MYRGLVTLTIAYAVVQVEFVQKYVLCTAWYMQASPHVTQIGAELGVHHV